MAQSEQDVGGRATGEAAGASRDRDASRAFLVSLIVITFLMNTIGRGITETFAVFLLPVEAGLGATRSEITATYSIYMLVHGMAAPFAGQLVDRLGARVTYATGLALLGTGYVLGGMADALWQYYLTVGAMSGLAAACLGMVVASSLLSRWFTNRLGAVMSLPYAAVGAGVLVIPPLTQLLLAHADWRGAHQLLGGLILAVLPVIMVLPLGRVTAGSRDWQAQRRSAEAMGLKPWSVTRAVRTPAFWALFLVYFWTAVAAYAVLPQSVAFLVERGFDPLVAAGAFGMTGALSALGIVLVGVVSDRLGRLATVTLSYLITITGIVSLIAVISVPSLLLVYGFVLCFGLMQGARGPIIAALVATLYRGGAVGSIFGALSLALGLGAGLGSWASGLLHDLTGGYAASFTMAATASFLGLATYWASASLRLERLDAATP